MRKINCVLVGLVLLMGASLTQAQGTAPVSRDWSAPVIVADTPTSFNRSTDANLSGVVGAVWADGSSHSFHLYYSRSSDKGASWSDPRLLINLGDLNANTWPNGIAAGDNGVWMVATTLRVLTTPVYPTYNGVLISYDSGATWGELVDLTQKFSYPENNPNTISPQDIAYAGNNTWIYLVTIANSICYLRSTDNGASWGNPVFVHRYSNEAPRLLSSKMGNSVIINYWDYDRPSDPTRSGPGRRVSLISNDNGETWSQPIISSIAASDTNGTLLLADWYGTVADPFDVDGDFVIAYSADGGSTFNVTADPPSIKAVYPDLRYFIFESLTINSQGHIMLVGQVGIPIGFNIVLPRGGQMTRSPDFGKTWTPWEQLPHGLNTPPITAAQDVFVSVSGGPVEGVDHHVLYSRTLKSRSVTAAGDWQLYE